MEFLGTKGKWILKTFPEGQMSVRNESDTRKICVSRVQNHEESLANLKLISKAPEMLEMLRELANMHLDGNPIVLIKKAQQLIKEATTI